MPPNHTPTVLTIAGFDPYGGAGIQADTKTIHALGGYALTATTAVTAQNSRGVTKVEPISEALLKVQLETLLDDIKVDAVKIGMLGSAKLISVVSECIVRYELSNIVLDTVMVSSNGKRLLEKEAVDVMVSKLFSRVDLITPNIPEVNTFLNGNYSGEEDEAKDVALALFGFGANAILLKGGHGIGSKEATDHLAVKGKKIETFTTKRVDTPHTHGTGCVLSSAIAVGLAKGLSMSESVSQAKYFLYDKLQKSDTIYLPYVKEIHDRREPIL